MTYEGARSVTGPYLTILGESGVVVSVVGGVGEFIGYRIRILFGSLADRTGIVSADNYYARFGLGTVNTFRKTLNLSEVTWNNTKY
jgi:hypothetical protein